MLRAQDISLLFMSGPNSVASGCQFFGLEQTKGSQLVNNLQGWEKLDNARGPYHQLLLHYPLKNEWLKPTSTTLPMLEVDMGSLILC